MYAFSFRHTTYCCEYNSINDKMDRIKTIKWSINDINTTNKCIFRQKIEL